MIGKPFISSPPLSVVAKLGDPVALHCEAVGDPQPKVSFPSLGACLILCKMVSELDGNVAILRWLD